MSDSTEVTELRRQLKVAQYERKFLMDRLTAIRDTKARIDRLLDTPLLQEVIDAGGEP